MFLRASNHQISNFLQLCFRCSLNLKLAWVPGRTFKILLYYMFEVPGFYLLCVMSLTIKQVLGERIQELLGQSTTTLLHYTITHQLHIHKTLNRKTLPREHLIGYQGFPYLMYTVSKVHQ